MKKIFLTSFTIVLLSLSVAPTWIFAATCDSQTPGAQPINDGSGGIAGWNCPDGTFTSSLTGQTVQGTPTTPTPTPVAQQGKNLGYTPLEPIPGLTTSNDPNYLTNGGNLPDIINAIFKIFITVGALLAVLSLAVGGIQYMVSSSAELKNAGIDRAKAALWGIVLIAASWLILNTINPNLLKFNLNPCPNEAVGCGVTGGQTVTSISNNTPSLSGAGTVPTITTTDGNAAITAAQNQPAATQDPAIMQAAAQNLQQNQTYCANTLHGSIGPGEVSTGCAGDSPQHFLGNQIYTGCANIPTPSGGVQSCYFNQ